MQTLLALVLVIIGIPLSLFMIALAIILICALIIAMFAGAYIMCHKAYHFYSGDIGEHWPYYEVPRETRIRDIKIKKKDREAPPDGTEYVE